MQHHIFLTHSSVDGHLIYLLDIINNAAVNMCTWIFFCSSSSWHEGRFWIAKGTWAFGCG